MYDEVKFDEKKIFDPQKGSQVRSKNRKNDHFGGVGQTNFFFREKQVDRSIFWGEISRRLLCCWSHYIIISGSQS